MSQAPGTCMHRSWKLAEEKKKKNKARGDRQGVVVGWLGWAGRHTTGQHTIKEQAGM